MGDVAVDGTTMDNVVDGDATVDDPEAATERRRQFLCRHNQGGEA